MAGKRRIGPRGKSGRLLDRSPARPAILAETYRQRARLVGLENADREEAASSVGRLFLAGRIERCHYEAAQKLLMAWKTWSAMAQLPPRTAGVAHYGLVAGSSRRPDVSDEAWYRAKARYQGAIDAVGQGMSWSAVENLVIDDAAPARLFEEGAIASRVYGAMIEGLDALIDYFGVQRCEVKNQGL
ncbi:hypothetical protein [Telmatospirillum siberiense]|uniref:Uncharacterized protein n=1 Tax=Telmatospirillum siberiense TaxID=382514 RepID=A0A2N3PRX8_9PROT|nr:hypothetical protein [Telmatospirillum siberiense]PKU23161.1 hypothetical protein CWS72_18220 [Telmatospirillum siberiense]